MKTLVLAGNHTQFKQYLHEKGFDENDYVYAQMPHMVGHRYSSFVVVGTFWDRSDASDLFEEVERRVVIEPSPSGDRAGV